jgi:hypothetical protein
MSDLTSAFPVTLVDLMNEVMKLIQGSGLVKMDQLTLDSFWHGSVRLLIERRVVVVEHSRNSVKVDEELRHLMVVLHHQLFELDLS